MEPGVYNVSLSSGTVWDVHSVSAAMQKFGWPDYLIFVCMLVICIVIGIYFGFIKTAKTELDYLVGGRNMSVFPVAMSLIASFFSGISLLGIPTEIYVYGIQYMYIMIGVIFMGIAFHFIYLPVFHDLKLTSTFEYLEKRFDRRVRVFGSVLSVIGTSMRLPVVIYIPALTFNQVTGVNVHLVTPIVCLICVFYTSVGGLKAVVWTDVIQSWIMIGAMFLVAVKGTLDVGGFEVVWERNWNSGRIESPDFDFSPLKRHTIWSLSIGGFVFFLQSSALNQDMIQRYLSLPNLKTANRALWICIAGLFGFTCLCTYCGLLIYATYEHCDPITTQLARRKDQLLPLLVMEVLSNFRGFSGLFVAGIFSASLSSLSTSLNSMAAVILNDFYRPCFKTKLTEAHNQIVMKSTVVISGVIFVGLVFVVERLGTVLQLTMSIFTISAGPSLALFTMGLLIPWINSTGALIGGVSGLGFMSWIILGAQATIAAGSFKHPEKPVSVDGCEYDFVLKENSFANLIDTDEESVFMLYRLSYLWYTLLGAFVSCAVGTIVSLLYHPNDPRDIDPALLTPSIRKWIQPRVYSNHPLKPDTNILAYEAVSTDPCCKSKLRFYLKCLTNLFIFYRIINYGFQLNNLKN